MKLREIIPQFVRQLHTRAYHSMRIGDAAERALLEGRAVSRLEGLLEARFGNSAQLLIAPDRAAADPVLRIIVRATGNLLAQQHLTILYVIRHVMEYYGLPFEASVQTVDAESHARADRVH